LPLSGLLTAPLFGPDGILISPGPGIPAEADVGIAVVRDRGPVTPLRAHSNVADSRYTRSRNDF